MEDGPSTSELVQIVADLRRELAANKAEQEAKEGKVEKPTPRGSLLNACLSTPPTNKHKSSGKASPQVTISDDEASPHATPFIPYLSPLTPADCPTEGGSAKGGCGGKATGGKGNSDRFGPYDAAADRTDAETTSFGQGADGQGQPR